MPPSVTWSPTARPMWADALGEMILVLGGPAFTPTWRTLFIVAPPPLLARPICLLIGQSFLRHSGRLALDID